MSAEIARAFCVRMMTDEDFRAALAGVRETAEIDKIMADEKYSFTKDDLNKVVGEVVGHKLEDGELEKLVCGFYEEQMASGNPDACKVLLLRQETAAPAGDAGAAGSAGGEKRTRRFCAGEKSCVRGLSGGIIEGPHLRKGTAGIRSGGEDGNGQLQCCDS